VYLKRSAHEIFDEIDFGAVQQTERDIVDNDGKHRFASNTKSSCVPLLVESKAVLDPEHPPPETVIRRNAFSACS